MHSKSEDQKEDTTVLVQYLPFFSLRLLGASLCSSFVADIGTMSSDDEDGYRVNAFKGNTSGDSDSSDMDSDDDMLLSRRKTQSKIRHHRLWNLLHFSSLFFTS